jgi:hypothetical protein
MIGCLIQSELIYYNYFIKTFIKKLNIILFIIKRSGILLLIVTII